LLEFEVNPSQQLKYMENTQEQIMQIINNSSLTDEQKQVWNDILANLDEELLQPILETIQNDEAMLAILTKNLEDKVSALAYNEPGAWDSVVDGEKQTLQNIDE